VKDSIDTKDYPTTGGTPGLRNSHPVQDAAVLDRLRSAGAIVLGKTNLHELSYGWTSNNEAFGPVHNPYDVSRIPGGSSGGTAVAVATRMAPAGLSEDTCGSIRVPAALCGIAGLRPTTLRWPQRGVIPVSAMSDTVGPHARTVSDLALLDSVVTGSPIALRPAPLGGVRLAVSPHYFFSGLDVEVEKITRDAIKRLSDHGAEIVEIDVPDLKKLIEAANFPILQFETVPSINQYLKESGLGLTFDDLISQASPGVRWVLENYAIASGKFFPPKAVYEEARKTHRPALQATFRRYFRDNGIAALIVPPTLCPATSIGVEADIEVAGQKVPVFVAYARNIAPGSCAALPGLVLPAGLTSTGMPVGVEFDAPVGKDRDLLALGVSLEKALGPVPAPSV